MDTRPIFNYLCEVMDRKHFASLSGRAGSLPEAVQEYEDYLSEMETEFEAGVFQCMAESSQFKEQLSVVANKLKRVISVGQRKEQEGVLDDSPKGASMRVAMKMAENSLRFLEENYDITTRPLMPEVKEEEEEAPLLIQDERSVITGVRGLAKAIGVGVNKAQAIVNSRILERDGIQWNAGNWKFDRAKLIDYLNNNPEAFSKIKCSR